MITDPAPVPPPDPREDKLPKWAQIAMANLRTHAENWQAHAQRVRAEANPGSPVCLDWYSASPVGLPPNETIYFCDPNSPDRRRPNRPEALVSVRWRENVLIVDSLNSEPLIAVPSASNVMRLAAAPRVLREHLRNLS